MGIIDSKIPDVWDGYCDGRVENAQGATVERLELESREGRRGENCRAGRCIIRLRDWRGAHSELGVDHLDDHGGSDLRSIETRHGAAVRHDRQVVIEVCWKRRSNGSPAVPQFRRRRAGRVPIRAKNRYF